MLVGDRGIITTHKAIGELRQLERLAWITALKSGQIRTLIEGGALQLGLFDERHLFELTHPAYPRERLIARRNPELGRLRARKRQESLQASAKELQKVRASIDSGEPLAKRRSASASGAWRTSTR